MITSIEPVVPSALSLVRAFARRALESFNRSFAFAFDFERSIVPSIVRSIVRSIDRSSSRSTGRSRVLAFMANRAWLCASRADLSLRASARRVAPRPHIEVESGTTIEVRAPSVDRATRARTRDARDADGASRARDDATTRARRDARARSSRGFGRSRRARTDDDDDDDAIRRAG